MSGYIFLCNVDTEKECLERLLLGTNNPKFYNRFFKYIEISDWIFLYNYDNGKLRGPFKAISKCDNRIVSEAWDNKYPFQIRVDSTTEFDQPLQIGDIDDLILFKRTNMGLIPEAKISNDILKNILLRFKDNNNDKTPIEEGGLSDKKLATAFIFRCDSTTGGTCFHDNIMGAPVTTFRNVVSKVQPGSIIFLWQIEKHELYGVWKAVSRGEYDPKAFDGRFPSVVKCERYNYLERGLNEEKVKTIIPFEGKMPPYIIDYERYHKLVDTLLEFNNKLPEITYSAETGKYLTEDGHLVHSLGEVIIDNWLYNKGIIHAYNLRIQVGEKYIRCDFFLPSKKVCIEYWGMVGDVQYDNRRREKIRLYHQYGINLLEIFPVDLSCLSEILSFKLRKYNINVI